MTKTPATRSEVDAVVVGAGFAGLYMLHQFRQLGLEAIAIDAADDVGGTWYWNRYPGARCDVESLDYSYSFSEELMQEWEWSERFPAQPEILAYLQHVADRFDLRRSIRFGTTVQSAHWDEEPAHWTLRTDAGERITARYCVMATGCLSIPKDPDIPGLSEFRGEVLRSSRWPHEPVDFTGRQVGVIGTGSTGIQIIPAVAGEADHLYVFQRTPSFTVPARNRPLTDEELREVKERYTEYKAQLRRTSSGMMLPVGTRQATETDEAERRAEFRDRWELGGPAYMRAFTDLLKDPSANEMAADFAREMIDEVVDDPETAESLKPHGYPIGARRVCLDTHYYQTYNREDVTLVDLRKAPMQRLTETSVETDDGSYPIDTLILATGFDAMTGALMRMDIVGRDGVRLRERWADGPRTYLGLAISGFPNLFVVTGPGSPSVLSNMVLSIEQHVEWIADCIAWLEDRGFAAIEANDRAQEEWVEHVNEVADQTLYPRANTWYTGANIEGKPQMFMPYVGGVDTYARICADVAAKDYEGFSVRTNATKEWETV